MGGILKYVPGYFSAVEHSLEISLCPESSSKVFSHDVLYVTSVRHATNFHRRFWKSRFYLHWRLCSPASVGFALGEMDYKSADKTNIAIINHAYQIKIHQTKKFHVTITAFVWKPQFHLCIISLSTLSAFLVSFSKVFSILLRCSGQPDRLGLVCFWTVSQFCSPNQCP